MLSPSAEHDVPFRARLILLGASNLTKAVSTVIETAQHLLGGPLDIYAAIGHGRSYGIRSTVIVRSLPSILESRVWEVLARAASESPLPTYALVTDIGNDVMYGPPPAQIAEWVRECFDRLGSLRAKAVCTSLPLARVERLNEWQYLIVRSIFFPTRRFTFAEAMERAGEVVERIEHLAARRGIPFIELPEEWYGVDPIHIHRRCWPEAWGMILYHWVRDEAPEAPTPRATGSLSRWFKLRSKSPERWWLMGMERGRPQPCAVLRDGTRVSFY